MPVIVSLDRALSEGATPAQIISIAEWHENFRPDVERASDRYQRAIKEARRSGGEFPRKPAILSTTAADLDRHDAIAVRLRALADELSEALERRAAA